MEKKKKIILFTGLLAALAVIIIILISALFPNKNGRKEQVQITLPDAQVQDIPRAKIKVYDNGKKPVTSYDEYIRRVTSTDMSHPADSVMSMTGQTSEQDNPVSAMQEAAAARRTLSENIRNAGTAAPQPQPDRTEENRSSVRSTPRISPTTPENWQERYDYIYNKYYKEKETDGNGTPPEKQPDTAEAVTPAATGFITVVGGGTANTAQAIRVSTTRETELQSGDKVQLRLLAETTLSGVTLPRNTYIYAIASVSDNRLQLSVSSISYSGGILPCTLSAYDADGYRGLSFIDSQTSKNINNEVVSGLSSAASTVAATVSGLASRAISSASRLAGKQNQSQQQTVRLPADYQFILR